MKKVAAELAVLFLCRHARVNSANNARYKNIQKPDDFINRFGLKDGANFRIFIKLESWLTIERHCPC